MEFEQSIYKPGPYIKVQLIQYHCYGSKKNRRTF